MLRVGLTGGIATGKSHVASIFRELGCMLIEADEVARTVVKQGQPAYQEIIREFGPGVLREDGDLNRTWLAQLIFQEPQRRHRLNEIVHPRVIEGIKQMFKSYQSTNPTGLVIVDGALIIEAGVQALFDQLIVVHCRLEQQIERLMSRDGLDRDEAARRIESQMSSKEKLRYADFEVDTTGTFDCTREQVRDIYEQLCQLAAS